jgi:hypothetical protein
MLLHVVYYFSFTARYLKLWPIFIHYLFYSYIQRTLFLSLFTVNVWKIRLIITFIFCWLCDDPLLLNIYITGLSFDKPPVTWISDFVYIYTFCIQKRLFFQSFLRSAFFMWCSCDANKQIFQIRATLFLVVHLSNIVFK